MVCLDSGKACSPSMLAMVVQMQLGETGNSASSAQGWQRRWTKNGGQTTSSRSLETGVVWCWTNGWPD
jgi:hypothetical protein